MKIVGTATQKGTSPKFVKRKHPLYVRSRIGGNSQFSTWNLTTRLQNWLQAIKLFEINDEKPDPSIMITVKVNGEECSMELDTGASVSIVSEEAWRKRFPTAPLEESQIELRTYTGEALDIIGQANVQVTYQDNIANLPLQIIKAKRTKPIWKKLA